MMANAFVSQLNHLGTVNNRVFQSQNKPLIIEKNDHHQTSLVPEQSLS